MREWMSLLLIGTSMAVCYFEAKKKRRNTVLAIVLGLLLNVVAAIAYLLIRALPDSSDTPPDLDLEGYRSVRSGVIGAAVALLAFLFVWSLAGSLTGGEGDLGPGLAMLSVYGWSIIAVGYLGIAAILRGVSSLHAARETNRPTRAGVGIALGAFDLCAAVGGIVIGAVEVAANA
jgi:hypothetical protein